jgi:hypothetical protein
VSAEDVSAVMYELQSASPLITNSVLAYALTLLDEAGYPVADVVSTSLDDLDDLIGFVTG